MIRVDQVGVPTYDELVLVVRKSTIINHAGEIRLFVQALARGYEAARSDPQAAVQNLVHAKPGLDPTIQIASERARALVESVTR